MEFEGDLSARPHGCGHRQRLLSYRRLRHHTPAPPVPHARRPPDAALLLDGVATCAEAASTNPIETELRRAGMRVLEAREDVARLEDARDQVILEARGQGMTQQAIADATPPGVTRGRVMQIISKARP